MYQLYNRINGMNNNLCCMNNMYMCPVQRNYAFQMAPICMNQRMDYSVNPNMFMMQNSMYPINFNIKTVSIKEIMD